MAMELTPIEQEISSLRDENRRLKALLELREDRSKLEKYQIDSRNKLVLLYIFVIVILGGSWLSFSQQKALKTQIAADRATIKRLRAGDTE